MNLISCPRNLQKEIFKLSQYVKFPSCTYDALDLASNVCDQIPLTEAQQRATCVTEKEIIGCLVWKKKIHLQERTMS